MHHNKKTVVLALIATVLALNVFVAGLLAYALSAAKERKEQEVRTTVENMALLLDRASLRRCGRSSCCCARCRCIWSGICVRD